MALAQTLPSPTAEAEEGSTETEPIESAPAAALVATPAGAALEVTEAAESLVLTKQIARLPVELDVSVPVRNFRVRNLLTLGAGDIVESSWGHGDDVPISAGVVRLAWCEFEVIETILAARVTRLG